MDIDTLFFDIFYNACFLGSSFSTTICQKGGTQRGPMVDRSFLLINFRSICSLIYARTFWDTLYSQLKQESWDPISRIFRFIFEEASIWESPDTRPNEENTILLCFVLFLLLEKYWESKRIENIHYVVSLIRCSQSEHSIRAGEHTSRYASKVGSTTPFRRSTTALIIQLRHLFLIGWYAWYVYYALLHLILPFINFFLETSDKKTSSTSFYSSYLLERTRLLFLHL